MKKVAAFLILLCCLANLQAQWTEAGGPRSTLYTVDLVVVDTFLVASTICEPLFSADPQQGWDYVQGEFLGPFFMDHFVFQGTTYVYDSDFYSKLLVNGGAVGLEASRIFPTQVSRVEADSTGIYCMAADGGLMTSATDSNFVLHDLGLPIDTIFYPGGYEIHRYGYSVAINRDHVFVGTAHGVYKSDKDTIIFTAANAGLPDAQVRAIFCLDSLLIANIDNHIYRSTDEGTTWTLVPNSQVGICNKLQLVGNTLFASIRTNGVFSSPDLGLTWSFVDPALHNVNTLGAAEFEGKIYIASADGLYYDPWNIVPVTYNGCGSIMISMAATDNCIAAATQEDVYTTTDQGAVWTPVPTGIAIYPRPMVVALDNQILWGSDRYLGFPLSTYISDDCAMAWDTTSFTGSRIDFLSSDGHHALVNIDFADYWLISDSGATLTAIQPPTPIECQTAPIMIVVGDAIYATSCDNTILLRTLDHGQTWTDVGAGLPQDRVCYMERLGGRLFATFQDDIYQALSGDSVWIPSNIGLPNNAGPYFDLEWDGQQYYVCNGRQVWASLDGISWVNISTGLPDLGSQTRIYSGMALKDSILYMGTWGRGVWRRPISELSVSVPRPVSPTFVNFYPNPTNDRIHWSSDEILRSVQCFNTMGEQLPIAVQGNSMDLSALAPGVYVLRATSLRGAVQHVKVVKR